VFCNEQGWSHQLSFFAWGASRLEGCRATEVACVGRTSGGMGVAEQAQVEDCDASPLWDHRKGQKGLRMFADENKPRRT
jgi:hypothetical protein